MSIIRMFSLAAALPLVLPYSPSQAAPVTQPAPVAHSSPATTPHPPTQAGAGQPYALLGTQVWDIPDPASGRQYQAFVALPPSYDANPHHRYPVLYVTDADYAFPVIRQLSSRLNVEGAKVDDFILVGISYAHGEDALVSRRRDYTPTPHVPRNAPAGSVHGGGAAHITYLREQMLPFIAQRYRTDETRRMFLGHSYGSLLGAQILFSEPELFSGYILGSPSLWFDNKHMLTAEQAYAKDNRDLAAKVYVFVGEYEAIRQGDPRFNTSFDMVADAQHLTRALQSRGYRNLVLKTEVLNDEDHLSVAPRGFTKGLRFLLTTK